MSRKSALLALAAAVSLGAFALSASDALAFHPVGSGMRVGTGSLHVNPGLRYGTYHTPAFKIVKLPPPIVHPPYHWHWHWAWHHRYWIPPVVVGGGAVAATYAAVTPAAPPTSGTCNCLTKQYTPEGAVVFKDVCTNEMAMNPPAGADTAQPQQGYAQPQQQGYLQPQTQAQ